MAELIRGGQGGSVGEGNMHQKQAVPAEFRQCPRALIVEAEILLSVVLEDCLEAMGFQVVAITTNAVDAVQAARQHNPHIILMDIRINGTVDGIDAGRQIGAELGTPIIIVTGSVSVKEAARIEKMPTCRGVLPKPVSYSELAGAIRSVTGSG